MPLETAAVRANGNGATTNGASANGANGNGAASKLNGSQNGSSNGHANGHANGYANGASNGHAPEAADKSEHAGDMMRQLMQVQSDAPPCSDCGSMMIRAGACYKCPDCGTTSGCG